MDEIKQSSQNDELATLKNIGSSEIAKATHIQAEYVEYILNKDFSKLISYNAKGFIRIIEREFDLSLQGWYDEFLSFKSEMNIKDESTIRHVVAKNICPTSSYERRASDWWLWILMLICAVGAVFYFKLYQYIELIPSLFDDRNRSTTYSDTSVIDSAQAKLEIAGVDVPKFDEDKNLILNNDINITIGDDNETFVAMNALDRSIKIENGVPKEANKTDENQTQSTDTLIQSSTFIVPSKEIWIGTILLDGGAKTTLTTSVPFELNLSKDQLVLTGHGVFELENSGEKEIFKDRNPIRFLIKDGKISKISYDEFLKFNNGRAW